MKINKSTPLHKNKVNLSILNKIIHIENNFLRLNSSWEICQIEVSVSRHYSKSS